MSPHYSIIHTWPCNVAGGSSLQCCSYLTLQCCRCHGNTALFMPDPAMLQVPPHYSRVHTWPCNVTEPTVHTRVPCCRCHSLTYLNVNYCEHISEAGIELLGLTHSLVSLDISGCNCGDQGLSALGNNTRLRDVCLSECMNITDLGLQKFAQQCHEIQRLDLSHCMVTSNCSILCFTCRFSE